MSDTHDEAHTGPIKNPKQLLVTVIFAFVLPVFAIIGLVLFVTADKKPAAGSANPELAVAQRIQKIGNVEVRYDPIKQRVVYEPVSIESRTLVPRVIRHDNRYDPALIEGRGPANG